jgi:hypothetical protein
MKYKIISIEKPGLINHWDQLELPENVIPLHTEIWKKTHSKIDIIHDIEKIFNEDGYKYDKETGEVIQSRKDGRGLEEFKIFTKIYCLVRVLESEEDRQTRAAENSSKIAKMIEDIKKRRTESFKGKYNFIDRATNIRKLILEIEEDTKEFKSDVSKGDMDLAEVSDKGEILANITLASRHLEDARLRLRFMFC